MAKKKNKDILDDEIKESIVYDDNDTDYDEASQKEVIEESSDKNIENKDEISQKEIIEESSDGNIETKDETTEKVSDKKTKFVIEAVSKTPKWLKISIAAFAFLVIASTVITYLVITDINEKQDNLLNVDYFYEGIYIDDIPLGGLTKEQAKELLYDANTLRADEVSVSIVWEDEEILFTSKDIDVTFDTDSVIEEAWSVGRTGENKERYQYVLDIIDNPISFTTQMSVDPSPIEVKVKAAAIFRQQDPGEASVTFNPDPELEGAEWFIYTEPVVGIETDAEELWQTVQQVVLSGQYGKVDIPNVQVLPTTTIEDLKQKTQLIVQFVTHMSRDANREHNVRLACSQINGTILMPGEIFSMNDVTGDRTKEAGYKDANVIVGGNQLIPGIAGGVCQVSGTLFNAAVRADLEIIERHHHSFELSYLTRGRDATVNYGTADLRFKNTSDSPMYISMYTIGRDVYAEIYGVPLPDGMSIGMDVVTTKTEQPGPTRLVSDPEVSVAESPLIVASRLGIRCTSYKVYYDKDGKIIEKVQLFNDYYRPYPKEYHYNPAVLPASLPPGA